MNTNTKDRVALLADQPAGMDFLNQGHRYCILSGSAGVGKTTVVAEYCNRSTERIMVTAPTHKAVSVLRNKVMAQTATIHSYLKLRRVLRGRKYKYEYVSGSPVEYFDVVVIDEASMIDTDLLTAILQASEDVGFRVIFVGDDKQLNPVNEDDSPVFLEEYPRFELTEILRHQNDIIDLSRNIQWLYDKKSGQHFKWYESANFPMEDLVAANGTDQAKFICWTNKTVAAVNNAVRSQIYENPAQFEFGEILLLTEHYGPYKNNEEVMVEMISEGYDYYSYETVLHPNLKVYYINEDLKFVAVEDSIKYEQNVKFLKDKCIAKLLSWKAYYDYIESFAHYQYNHAITVHKSQGSTYKKSLVYVTEIMNNRNQVERRRMLYTAITRAAEMNLFL